MLDAGLKVSCTVAAVLLLQAGLYCFRQPAPPQWDIDLLLPAYKGLVRFSELLDPARFNILPDSTILFTAVQSLDTVRPSGAIDFLTVDEPCDVSVSDFVLPALGCALSGLGIEELIGTSLPDSGAKRRIEPFVITGSRVCHIDDVERIEAAEGHLQVEVNNRTGLEFDSLLITTPCGSFRLDGLTPGETRWELVTVAGQEILSPLEFTFTAGSPGSRSDSLWLQKTDSLRLAFSLSSVRLIRGRLRVPAVQVERRCAVFMTSSRPLRIDSLLLDGGECEFVMVNRFGFPVSLKLDAQRLGKTEELCLDGKQSASAGANLNGVRMNNRARTNALFDFRVTARVERSDGYVDIEKSDGLFVRCQTVGLKPREVAGEFLEPVYVAAVLDTVADFRPFLVHGIRMAEAELVVDLGSQVGFPVETELRLTALRNGRVSSSTTQLLSLPPATSDQPAQRSWTIPLTALVNCGPDLITAEYVTRILGQGWFTADAGVAGNAFVASPLRLALVPDTVSLPVRRIAITPAQREALKDHLVSGEARLTVTNRFPFAASGTLTFAPDSGGRSPETRVDSLTFCYGIPSGRTDRLGYCVAPRETTLSFELDSVQASLFKTWPLNARLQLLLPRSDTVILRASDYMGVEALLGLKLRIQK